MIDPIFFDLAGDQLLLVLVNQLFEAVELFRRDVFIDQKDVQLMVLILIENRTQHSRGVGKESQVAGASNVDGL